MVETVVYDQSGVERYSPDDLAVARDAPRTTWVRAAEATPEEFDRVADAFGIHPLSVEDVRGDVRPKAERFPNHTFLLLRTATLAREDISFDKEIRSDHVGLFLGRDWLVTLSEDRVPAVTETWNAAVSGESRVTGSDPDFAAYRVVDGAVDDCYALLDELKPLIEAVEGSVLEEPDPAVLSDLNAVRRDLLSFRKVVWPTCDAVSAFARGDPDEVRDTTEKYYRDVYDHLV